MHPQQTGQFNQNIEFLATPHVISPWRVLYPLPALSLCVDTDVTCIRLDKRLPVF
jgi:hypothetical protein